MSEVKFGRFAVAFVLNTPTNPAREFIAAMLKRLAQVLDCSGISLHTESTEAYDLAHPGNIPEATTPLFLDARLGIIIATLSPADHVTEVFAALEAVPQEATTDKTWLPVLLLRGDMPMRQTREAAVEQLSLVLGGAIEGGTGAQIAPAVALRIVEGKENGSAHLPPLAVRKLEAGLADALGRRGRTKRLVSLHGVYACREECWGDCLGACLPEPSCFLPPLDRQP